MKLSCKFLKERTGTVLEFVLEAEACVWVIPFGSRMTETAQTWSLSGDGLIVEKKQGMKEHGDIRGS